MSDVAMKVQLIFQSQDSGWSETYYFAVPTSATTKQVSDSLREARVKVLGGDAFCVGSRISFTDKPRVVYKYAFSDDGQATASGDGQGTVKRADQPHAAILMPFRSSAGTRRYVTISAPPDVWIERDKDNAKAKLSAGAAVGVDTFAEWLVTTPWALNVRERDRTGAGAPKTVSNIEQHTDGRYKITLSAAHGLAVADKVVLTRLKGNNLVNAKGVHKVAEVPSATVLTINAGPRADLGVIMYLAGGQLSKLNYSYGSLSISPEPYIVSTRKRGRVFSSRRGRRSASR